VADDAERARDRLRPCVERAAQASGWRLDDVAPRRLGPGEPWRYATRASEMLARAGSALDMGTGGGELLESVGASRAGRLVATEPWAANAPVAARRLGPLGIPVVKGSSLALPFRAGAFDLVLNRHEELDPAEVARVLAPGGSVLTQQVGRGTWAELRPWFPRMHDPGDLLEAYADGMRAAGLRIVRRDRHAGPGAYRGLEDVVFILCIAPWTIPGFDPLGRDLRALLDAEARLSGPDGIVLTEELLLLEATKGP